jgi:asparagine synthase (glutamine-hydrolysing)
MCGILARLRTKAFLVNTRITSDTFESQLKKLDARGPEGSQLNQVNENLTLGFTRLAINGLTNAGMQPYTKGPITWICNGEIYNSKDLEKSLGLESTGSDCECIGDLYLRHRDDLATFARALDGVFAIILYDSERNQLIVTRDPYGIRPLFLATLPTNDAIEFSSEIKAIGAGYDAVVPFLPGFIRLYDANTTQILQDIRYHDIPWITNPQFHPSQKTGFQDACVALRLALEEAVRKRLLTDRPVAALLSGGLDSSLIAALVQRNLKQLGKPPLKTFSIGFEGSSDVAHARMVADWIGSDHTEIIMTPDEFFEAIPEVIKAIESYDTTTVRASTGNYLIAKKIRELTDCKVVFNGDGSDEVFGGYLYFNNAPNDDAFQAETGRLLKDIHYFDVLRSDRSISANGLEARTPFLDKQFIAVVRSIHPSFLRPKIGGQVEKEILRCAFDDDVTLPIKVLWRRKEAFSDGVSTPEKAWFQEIQERLEKGVHMQWEKNDVSVYQGHIKPRTGEDYYYWFHFVAAYGIVAIKTAVPYRWMPRWCPGAIDPSARTLEVYRGVLDGKSP